MDAILHVVLLADAAILLLGELLLLDALGPVLVEFLVLLADLVLSLFCLATAAGTVPTCMLVTCPANSSMSKIRVDVVLTSTRH